MTLGIKQSRHLATLISLALLIVILLAQFGGMPLLGTVYQRLELLAYDQRLQYHLIENEQDHRIVIIDIDEASLQQEGQWPWSRLRMAQLLQQLHDSGAILVGFDIVFAEPESNPALLVAEQLDDEDLLQRLHELAPQLDGDHHFARQLEQSEAILGYIFSPGQTLRIGQLPPPLSYHSDHPRHLMELPPMQGYSAPLPVLMSHSSGAGFFSLQPDRDGVVRRAPLLASYQDEIYPALSLEIIRRLFFLDEVTLETALINERAQIEAIHLDMALRIPTDGMGKMIIPFRGPPESFPYLSAHQVLNGDFDPQTLMGAIVLVGTTAPGLFDLRATPVNEIYPGVEVHANLIAAMLDQRFLHEPSWAKGANFALSLLMGFILSLLMPRLTPMPLVALSLLALFSVFFVTGWFWQQHGLVLALAGPLLVVLVITSFQLAWGFFTVSLNRHQLKEMFGQYIPPELVSEMSEQPECFSFDGESREMSVLFADIRSFTNISESLDANELKRLLNHYFTPMTRIIFENRGTIDKYVGDMIMAFWGAPVSNEQHAISAIDTALVMLAETERLKPEFATLGWPAINIGIGINSGTMNVGDMGSEYRRSYTVLGDAVNLASRLEGTTKFYGVGLVVGEYTRKLAGEAFVFRELDRVRVKGKHQAITIYQPMCRAGHASDTLLADLADYHRALELYRQRQWDQADALFLQLQQQHPDTRIYTLYRERITDCRYRILEEDWDGVYVRKSK